MSSINHIVQTGTLSTLISSGNGGNSTEIQILRHQLRPVLQTDFSKDSSFNPAVLTLSCTPHSGFANCIWSVVKCVTLSLFSVNQYSYLQAYTGLIFIWQEYFIHGVVYFLLHHIRRHKRLLFLCVWC